MTRALLALALLLPSPSWALQVRTSVPVVRAPAVGFAPAASRPQGSPSLGRPLALSVKAPVLSVPGVVNPTVLSQVAALAEAGSPAGLAAKRRDAKASADAAFDGALGEGGGDEPIDLQAERKPQRDLELRFSNDARKSLKDGRVSASVRLLKNPRSKWYWEQFAKDAPVRVLVGGKTMFVSRVTEGRTKAIAELTKKDFAGVYPRETIRTKTAAQLRKKLIADLTEFGERSRFGGSPVVTPRSEVRVVRFMDYKEAASLPENAPEPRLEPRPRQAVTLPPALGAAHKFLPKAVLLDLRLFPDAIPAELFEDMTKLMKAGVYVVMLTDDKPEAAEALLTKGLTNAQREAFTRYKLITLSDAGNSLAKYEGVFAKALPSARFTPQQLELMAFAGRVLGGFVKTSRGDELTFQVPSPDAFAKDFGKTLKTFLPDGAPYVMTRAGQDVRFRPTDLAGAIPGMLATLQDEEGLFVNASDLMVISRDEAVLKALEGSVQPARHTDARGAALADLAFASLLGAYRENVPGDIAASASKIKALKYKDKQGGDFYNVSMAMGHVMHAAFNWAVWIYRNTDVLPDADAVTARMLENWTREASTAGFSLPKPGEMKSDYVALMKARMKEMHRAVVDLLKLYPIAVGTELPNLHVFERYKGSTLVNRDILRLIFDFVVARRTPKGLEVMVVDFKTGETPTMQSLEKDIQVQLYDTVVHRAWDSLPLPYGVGGAAEKVSRAGVVFIYPSGNSEPTLTDGSRIAFVKVLRREMNKVRRQTEPPAAKKPAKKKRRKA